MARLPWTFSLGFRVKGVDSVHTATLPASWWLLETSYGLLSRSQRVHSAIAFCRHEAVTASVVNFAIASLQSEVGSLKVSTTSSSAVVTLSASPSRMNTSPGLWITFHSLTFDVQYC